MRIMLFILIALSYFSCSAFKTIVGNSSSDNQTRAFLNVEWVLLSETFTNGIISNTITTNAGIARYSSQFISNSGLFMANTYTNNSVYLTSSINYPVIKDDKEHFCVVIGPMVNIGSGITNIGLEYFYYIVNSNYCTITNDVFVGTNINNPSQTTNIYIVGGNSAISNRNFITLFSLTNSTNTNAIATETINWYLYAFWFGGGDTNTNLQLNGLYEHVYEFNSNNTYEYWELTNTNAYNYTTYAFNMINGNEISNFITYIFGVPSLFAFDSGTGADPSNYINWGSFQSASTTYPAYYYSNKIIITNWCVHYSNFTYTNIVSNGLLIYADTNTSVSNSIQPVYYELRPTTNLNLPE